MAAHAGPVHALRSLVDGCLLHAVVVTFKSPPLREDSIPMRLFLREQTGEGTAEVAMVGFNPAPILHGRRDVDQLDQCITDAWLQGDALGRLDQQRHPRQAILEGVLHLL